MPEICQIQAEIIEDFSFFDTWEDKYAYLIDLGRQLPSVPEADKTAENLVKGCQSQVWITHAFEDGKLNFQASSDAIIVSGLIALLLKMFSGQSPQAIVDAKLDFITEIGLDQQLSPARSNGLASMLKTIKLTAHQRLNIA